MPASLEVCSIEQFNLARTGISASVEPNYPFLNWLYDGRGAQNEERGGVGVSIKGA
jgi:hypothetical protein